jgi:hypothetical protein
VSAAGVYGNRRRQGSTDSRLLAMAQVIAAHDPVLDRRGPALQNGAPV